MPRFLMAAALLASLYSAAAPGQALPPRMPDPSGPVRGGKPAYLQRLPGTSDIYLDAEGNAYEAKVSPLNAGSCDDGGCTVKVCRGADGKLRCRFWRCTTAGCVAVPEAS
jgi:hypothetical protein